MAVILLIYEREYSSASFNSNKEKNDKTETTARLFCCCLGKPQQLHPRELFVGEKIPKLETMEGIECQKSLPIQQSEETGVGGSPYSLAIVAEVCSKQSSFILLFQHTIQSEK